MKALASTSGDGVNVSFEWVGVNRLDADVRVETGRQRPTVVLAALLFAAILTAVPAALGPVRLNDSFWIDLVWLDQFARELAHGNLYPRWLPLSHGGLGSPVFYYYPPLPFYIASAFRLTGLSTYLALIAAFCLAAFVSGAGVYLWLKDQCRAPLVGALLFMVAPYQLFNFYQRGAVAEFFATALLPFVLCGIRRISEGRRRGIAWTALAYGAVVMCHLPLALLASLFLFGPYALLASKRSPASLPRIVGSFALGVCVAAIYLVPALALEPYRSTADLWAFPYLQPATWTIWNAHAWSDQTFRAVVLVSAVLAIPAAGLVVRERSPWAIWALVCLLLAVGAVPLFWSLPVLRSVQFPFRLLPVPELALVTAVMLASKERAPWLMLSAAFLLMGAFIIAAKPASVNLDERVIRTLHPDVPENLPPGQRPYSWPSKWALDVAADHRQPQINGTVTVDPVFFFPSWQVRCHGRVVPTFAAPQTKLLAYRGRGCSRSLVWTTAEKVGATISLLALLALLSSWLSPWLFAPRRWRPHGSRLRNT